MTKAFQCMHQVATLTANTTDASVIDTRAAEKMQKRLNACVSTTSWLNYKKASTPQSFIDLGVDIAYSPYKLNYSYPGITPEEVVFRTMMALIYHTLQLDLVLYRGCHSVSIQATQELCDTIVGMVQYLCSQTKFLWWCLWSLWMVVSFGWCIWQHDLTAIGTLLLSFVRRCRRQDDVCLDTVGIRRQNPRCREFGRELYGSIGHHS